MLNDMSTNTADGSPRRRRRGRRGASGGQRGQPHRTNKAGDDVAVPAGQPGGDDLTAAGAETEAAPAPPQAQAEQPSDADAADAPDAIPAPPADFNPLRHPILFDTPHLLSIDSTWVGHVPLAYLMIDLCRPRVLVELGTHHGDSYCAFCQAIASLQVQARRFAIDTWEGDEQTGAYDDRILAALKAHHDPLYGTFSALLRTTFDDAVEQFEDGSIDLLHFDGPPTYRDAKHAFDRWLPKMSDRGVMLFHDVGERHEPGFGAWRAWEIASWKGPSFELTHAHGLGIVAVGSSPPPELLAFIEYANDNAAVTRQFFAEMGERMVDLQVLLRTTHWLDAQWKLIQHWRQATLQPGLPHFSIAESFGDPEPIARTLVEEVARLAQDNLDLRQPSQAPLPPPSGDPTE
jgi:hypothetical protein